MSTYNYTTISSWIAIFFNNNCAIGFTNPTSLLSLSASKFNIKTLSLAYFKNMKVDTYPEPHITYSANDLDWHAIYFKNLKLYAEFIKTVRNTIDYYTERGYTII